MISITYKLNKNIAARTANILNWNLKNLKSSIYIIGESGRKVNAKSLVGILSGSFKDGETIKVLTEDNNDLSKIKSYLNEVGTEI
jgi:phosphotransferase system HPr-like phosphotransfer protein